MEKFLIVDNGVKDHPLIGRANTLNEALENADHFSAAMISENGETTEVGIYKLVRTVKTVLNRVRTVTVEK